jgi:hypothetical protein
MYTYDTVVRAHSQTIHGTAEHAAADEEDDQPELCPLSTHIGVLLLWIT